MEIDLDIPPMVEGLEHFPPSVVEEAWNLAKLANTAHNEMTQLDDRLKKVEAVRGIPGVRIEVEETFYEDTAEERRDAATAFAAYTLMAAVVYGRPPEIADGSEDATPAGAAATTAKAEETTAAPKPATLSSAIPENVTEEKPTAVKTPKASKPKPKERPIESMGEKSLRELLFDRAQVGEQAEDFVSTHSLQRVARKLGQTPQQTASHWQLFDSLALLANEDKPLPDMAAQDSPVLVDAAGLAFLGRYKGSAVGAKERPVWGFTPTLFKGLVEGLRDSPVLQAQIRGYSESSQAALTGYLNALVRLEALKKR